MVEMSVVFFFPFMKLLNGTTVPDDHIAHYKHKMVTALIRRGAREACMCTRQKSTQPCNAMWQSFLNEATSVIYSLKRQTKLELRRCGLHEGTTSACTTFVDLQWIIKLPIPWGVRSIHGEQVTSRDFYKSNLKTNFNQVEAINCIGEALGLNSQLSQTHTMKNLRSMNQTKYRSSPTLIPYSIHRDPQNPAVTTTSLMSVRYAPIF